MDVFDARVRGIPCQVKVTRFNLVKGDRSRDSSDLDHEGFAEAEYEILDRRGRRALWLETKLDGSDRDKIHNAILCRMAEPVEL